MEDQEPHNRNNLHSAAGLAQNRCGLGTSPVVEVE